MFTTVSQAHLRVFPLFSSNQWDAPSHPASTQRVGLCPTSVLNHKSAELRCKCSLSTLSETLVLLVFFCFLVVLFFSFAPSRLFFFKKKRKKPAFWHSLRRKGGENIKRRKRGSLALARLSPTCGHVQPSQRQEGACYPDQTPSVFHSPAIAYKDDQLWIKWGFCFYSMQISLHAAWPPPPLLPAIRGLSPGHSMCLHSGILDQPSVVPHIKPLVTITWHRYFSISSVSSHFLYCYLFFQKPLHIKLICIPYFLVSIFPFSFLSLFTLLFYISLPLTGAFLFNCSLTPPEFFLFYLYCTYFFFLFAV